MVRFGAERERSQSSGFRCLPVACVVFDAADQQSDPPCLHQHFAVLLEREPLSPHLCDPAQPSLAFKQQLVTEVTSAKFM